MPQPSGIRQRYAHHPEAHEQQPHEGRHVGGSITEPLQVLIGSYEFSSFNVADSAITIGAALLVIYLLTTRQAHS